MTHARIASSYCACTGNAVHGSFLARKLDGRRQNQQTDDIYIYIYIQDNSSILLPFLLFPLHSYLSSPLSFPPTTLSFLPTLFFLRLPPTLSLHVNRECEKIREDSIQIRYRLKYLYKELQKSLSLLLTYWSPHCCNLHAPVGFKLFTIYCTLLGVSSMSYIILARCSNMYGWCILCPLLSSIWRILYVCTAWFSFQNLALLAFRITWRNLLRLKYSGRNG